VIITGGILGRIGNEAFMGVHDQFIVRKTRNLRIDGEVSNPIPL
jgi:hypothetical protein